jgi:hypothetical protein
MTLTSPAGVDGLDYASWLIIYAYVIRPGKDHRNNLRKASQRPTGEEGGSLTNTIVPIGRKVKPGT